MTFAPDHWTTKQLHTNEAIGWFKVSSEFDLQFSCIWYMHLYRWFIGCISFQHKEIRKYPKGLSPKHPSKHNIPPHQVTQQRPNQERSSVVMEEIQPTRWYGEYPNIPFFHRGSYATGGAGFHPLRVYFYAKVENQKWPKWLKHPVLGYLKHMWRCAWTLEKHSYSKWSYSTLVSPVASVCLTQTWITYSKGNLSKQRHWYWWIPHGLAQLVSIIHHGNTISGKGCTCHRLQRALRSVPWMVPAGLLSLGNRTFFLSPIAGFK